MFAVQLDCLPELMTDDNGNDNYDPKVEFMGEWTALPEKTDGGLFVLRFTYELETRSHQPEQWVQMKAWEIESLEA